jgi:transaldolase/glucose-6-phosphate isomerase
MVAAINSQTFSLPAELSKNVSETLHEWTAAKKVQRLWAGDASLWTGSDEDKWLGWLSLVDEQQKTIRRFTNFAAEVRDGGFSHAAVLGMGGSSLCPEVLSKSFGRIEGFPKLHVLDSTDPAQVKSLENRIELDNTLFFVSSKSGTTLEPNIFKQYFFERVREVVGEDKAGSRFVAITDPGSKLRESAEHDRFRKIFLGVPSVGGRYSALSDFGLAPACAMGIDVSKFLACAADMVSACRISPKDNPGVMLGAVLGVAHKDGRDKITIIASPGIQDFGAWLEQLVAESTGKDGEALIPVDRESHGRTDVYGDDRLFVYLRLESAPEKSQDGFVDSIAAAGHPVVSITVGDVYHLAQEFFRWEIATAVAGAIIGINPFNQPDVEASKIATRNLTDKYEETGALPSETPMFEESGIKLYTDEKNADELKGRESLSGCLKAHLDRLKPNDYFAMLAYIEMNDAHEERLQTSRHAVRDRKRVATCLGFGPRFLHSTGQAYKGGPNTGVFLQITCDDAADLAVPGQSYTFGVVKAAQARGDFQVLAERGRRALRVHLGADVSEGLAQLQEAITEALS